jgi:hypothetical protein
MEKEPTNRQQRRKKAAIERSKKPVPKYLSKDWAEKKKLVAQKVANKIAKVKARKVERLAKQEIEGTPVSTKDKKKLSPAEQKQVSKKVKRAKFAAKIKKLTGQN